jgi:hypothetical protein
MPKYLDLTKDYIERSQKMKELQTCDAHIGQADLMANVFVLVLLLGGIVYLIWGG